MESEANLVGAVRKMAVVVWGHVGVATQLIIDTGPRMIPTACTYTAGRHRAPRHQRLWLQ
jgi:hypothetical protein